MPSQPMTTIKVPKELRQRIAGAAADAGFTAAGLIAVLLDDYDRHARFAAVRSAYANVTHADVDRSYADETEEWDALADDGIDP